MILHINQSQEVRQVKVKSIVDDTAIIVDSNNNEERVHIISLYYLKPFKNDGELSNFITNN